MSRFAPFEPPLATSELPGTSGRIGSSADDFQVDEVPLYTPSGEGEHLYVRIRKREASTFDAVATIAKAAGVAQRDVGYAGQKDRHAVTTQWLSLPRGAAPPTEWRLGPNLEVLETSRHANKLRTGHLAGNRFAIRLVQTGPDAARAAQAILSRLASAGLPNYYGAQRFGRRGDNLDRAITWLRGGARSRGKKSRYYRNLYPSVVQAEVFNRYVHRRLAIGFDALLPGEIVRLQGSQRVFAVDDVPAETQRWHDRDVLPTGPMIGPKPRQAESAARNLETEAIAATGLDESDVERLARLAPGARRDVVVFPSEPSVESEPGGLLVRFGLPAGSFGTQLIRELIRAPWMPTES